MAELLKRSIWQQSPNSNFSYSDPAISLLTPTPTYTKSLVHKLFTSALFANRKILETI